MISLSNQPGEIRFTLQITRAATGKTETVEMVGRTAPADDQETNPPSETKTEE